MASRLRIWPTVIPSTKPSPPGRGPGEGKQLVEVAAGPVLSVRRPLILAACWAALAMPLVSRADDEIRRTAGEPRTLSGAIKEIASGNVAIEQASGGLVTVPIVEIESISFSGEPAALKTVRNYVTAGNYPAASETLAKIDMEKVQRKEIQQDVRFYQAFVAARQALAGAGSVIEAGKQVREFVQTQPNSPHLLEAQEALGDLLAAVGRHDQALKYYALLDQAPSAEWKMRAGAAQGRSLLAQQKIPEAQAAFDAVLAAGEIAGPRAAESRFAAQLGRGACLARSGQPQPAIEAVEALIAAASPEQANLLGPAYVTLGNCHRQQPDGAKTALLAFLHVDLLYAAHAPSHAEALANLSTLWNEVGKPERALQASQLLKERYPASPWASR
jgi:tetratricopeptide (TPR) repeat protein